VVLLAAGALTGYVLGSAGTAHQPTRTTSTTAPPTTTSPTAPRPEVEQPGWTPVTRARGAILVDRRTVGLADGDTVTIYRFRVTHVRFALHTGATDPPGVAAAVGAGSGPKISAAESTEVVAAFNGGFKVASGSGGFELDRHVFVPIAPGFASLVIDANGSAHVGAWGHGLPRPGEQVVSVRQNLQLLVSGARLSPLVNDLAAWGSTLGNVPAVARSALGEDAAGNLLFAASMHSLPLDVGTALLRAGAVRAMELDINPEWVQLDSTPHPGGVLVAGIPNQNRPGDQYSLGWTRDFVTVLAAPTTSARVAAGT
jgi:hypothetical protein